MRWALITLTLAALAAPAAAQEPTGGAKVYREAVPSVVWVHSARDRGLATGSGSLIDRGRQLVLTNYHVVEDNPRVKVFFPQFRDGRPVSEKSYYRDRADRFAIRGRVVAVDKKADLAVIQLDRVPRGVKAIPIAATSPGPGETVHAIGNTGKSGALWGYVQGTVRQVYRKKWKARLDPNRVLTFEAKVIETDSPTNPGDSGGPLLNDKGELVGVTQGGATDAQLVSTFVDVSEVKQLLATRPVHQLRADKPAEAAKRTTPLPVSDKAKLFSAEAVKAAEQAVGELFKKNLDLLIETYPSAPDEWAAKLKTARGEERQKVFRQWASARLRAAKADGVMILVSQDPRYVLVEIEDAVKGKFPEKYAQTVANALLKGLREKKPDEGLAEAVRLVREGYKGEKK
ncbi:MAG TPA: trypsin-like peptidase domain-containing protein [Fimbriiglobus sp.]|nr:trypsin-like peptidase domain-containing protein [Fimbriiglobus sp.]